MTSVSAEPRDSLLELGLCDLAAAIRRREFSASEAVDAALSRIAMLDGRFHAFCTVDPDAARDVAERIDQRLYRGDAVGPLAGVPVAVKDLLCTRGLRTTFGSAAYTDYVPEEDDIAVARLRAADAVIVGKTNTSEFGYGAVGYNSLFPATLNPWNTALGPGGSSAGSAVAVATGMVPLALGSDGGGSIRVPASLCGVFGLKPSFGRIPLYPGCRDERLPGASGWELLEHIGPLTRSADDAALAMAVMAGPAPQDRQSLPLEIADWRPRAVKRDIRIAFSADMGFAPVDSEIASIARHSAEGLSRELGQQTKDAHPDVSDPQACFEALVALDTDRVGLRRMANAKGVSFGPALRRVLERDWSADAFTSALLARKQLSNQMWRFMRDFDFLLSPTVATAAFAADLDAPATIAGMPSGGAGCAPLAAIANLTGLPAASVPVGTTRDGRPVGLQVMGRQLDDVGVLSICAAIERALPWKSWSSSKLSGT
jgi:aspartyl-tRNA(Asn)/glutamyl-tRNA(Gln) amidotransferase subunit A